MQRKYIINLKNYGSMPNVVLSQYDDKYNLIFEVYDGNRPADRDAVQEHICGRFDRE